LYDFILIKPLYSYDIVTCFVFFQTQGLKCCERPTKAQF